MAMKCNHVKSTFFFFFTLTRRLFQVNILLYYASVCMFRGMYIFRNERLVCEMKHSDQIYKLKTEEQFFTFFSVSQFCNHVFMTPNQSIRFSFEHITYIECNIHSGVLKSTWNQNSPGLLSKDVPGLIVCDSFKENKGFNIQFHSRK